MPFVLDVVQVVSKWTQENQINLFVKNVERNLKQKRNRIHMEDGLFLLKDGVILRGYYIEEIEKWGKDFVDSDEIDSLRYYPIQLEEGFTLRDYFTLVMKYPDVLKYDRFLPAYTLEAKRAPKSGCNTLDSDISHLELEYTISVEDYHKIKEELEANGIDTNPTIDNGYHFFGRGNENNWGVEFSSLDEMLDYEIKIGKKILYVSMEDKEFTIEDDFRPTFQEFIQEIIWELSFGGLPDQRDELAEEIELRVDEVEKAIQEGDESKFVPFNLGDKY